MSKLYFTSNLHFGDPRLEIFSRDFFFNSLEEMHDTIINNFNQILKPRQLLSPKGGSLARQYRAKTCYVP